MNPPRTTLRVPSIAGRLASGAFVLLVAVIFGLSAPRSPSQAVAQPPAPADPNAPVQLNFPNEVEIKVLVDLVSQRLGIKILYDEQIANKRISIKAPTAIPASSLVSVLESALKMKGLALVDAEAPGWKRIVVTSDLPNVAPIGRAQEVMDQFGLGTPLTQAFVLKHVDPQQVDQAIQAFLTKPGANSIPLPESGTLIITDYASNLLKLAKWIAYLDRPRPDVSLEFVPVANLEAAALAKQVGAILSAKAKAEGGRQPGAGVEIIEETRTNQLLLIGPRDQIDEALRLIRALDVPLGMVTRTYAFQNVDAERIDRLVQDLIDPLAVTRLYRSAIDQQGNLLIATTTEEIHWTIQDLQTSMDVADGRTQSPVRFYKVKNLPAASLLQTIRTIEGQWREGASAQPDQRPLPTDGRIRGVRDISIPGPNRPPSYPGEEPPTPPAVREEESGSAEATGVFSPAGEEMADFSRHIGRARITADPNTNTLIVVAEPAAQRIYAELIERLDRRRPQVLIETKAVIIDTSDDFSLGVEVSTGDGEGLKRLLAFTSYGLSTVDPVSGALALMPGLGFNGTLVDPDTADVVLRALTSHRRARVVTAPRILVSDNATGQLSSVAEVPFTSVNASQTVATTSFAGFAEAGTTITVTPRVSEEDHLQLDFSITLNAFTGSGGEGVPPPRQTDEVSSQVTIPDGHTIIVGGLSRRTFSHDTKGIPLIEKIPLLKHVGGQQTRSSSCSSLFFFIRPIVLRDDKFKDLKFLSRRDGRDASVPSGFPRSEPVWMH